jgi:hypothetical protein
MFVSKFSVEDWQGTQNHSSLQPVECWPDIEAAIQELDGQRKTLVTLEADGEIHMAIGGGPYEYLVYLTLDNETFHCTNPLVETMHFQCKALAATHRPS